MPTALGAGLRGCRRRLRGGSGLGRVWLGIPREASNLELRELLLPTPLQLFENAILNTAFLEIDARGTNDFLNDLLVDITNDVVRHDGDSNGVNVGEGRSSDPRWVAVGVLLFWVFEVARRCMPSIRLGWCRRNKGSGGVAVRFEVNGWSLSAWGLDGRPLRTLSAD
ncbi:hypothetical protein HYQ46_006338 [Verticillium longisporum]|nr:hypothetical protein HYQ46_006338 [Verticillium longisporum]